MPSMYSDKELELRAELSKLIERGKADVTINIGNGDLAKKSNINKEVVKAYYDELNQLREDLKINDHALLDTVLKLPQVLGSEKAEGDEEQWKAINILM